MNHREKAVWCARIGQLDEQDRAALARLLDDMTVAAVYNLRVTVTTHTSPRAVPSQ